MQFDSLKRLWTAISGTPSLCSSSRRARAVDTLDMNGGYFVPRLVSVIVPVLDVQRRWTPAHGLSRPRSVADLLQDLAGVEDTKIEVIAVFNQNEAGLADFIQRYPRIDKHCVNSTNVGVSRAWNMGAMLAEGEYLCFVNDDVELGPRALTGMREALAADASVGEVGPAGGRFINGSGGQRVGLDRMEDADEISGFLFMTTRRAFDAVGGFDIRFTPAGYEEIDFSFKVRHAGLRCCVIPHLGARHHHHDGVSSTNRPIRFFGIETSREQLHQRNRRIFCDKWGTSSIGQTRPVPQQIVVASRED